LRRRLSEAIGITDESNFRGNPPPAPPVRETWRAPGNVVIEEGLSQMSWLGQPARAPAPNPVPREQPPEPFKPTPPVDVRRGHRRMPGVEDFPPLAQQEYRAKVGYGSQTSQDRLDGAPDEDDEPRRGLLQRIIGRARREAVEAADKSSSTLDRLRKLARPAGDPPVFWDESEAARVAARPDARTDEQSLLPVFFNRLRK
jgi:cell division protein FtsZ